MEEATKIHVGLDVHKDSITVAAAEPGRSPGHVVSKLAHDVNKLLRMLAKLGPPQGLHVVYEAGPTGYGLQPRLAPGQGQAHGSHRGFGAVNRKQDFHGHSRRGSRCGEGTLLRAGVGGSVASEPVKCSGAPERASEMVAI